VPVLPNPAPMTFKNEVSFSDSIFGNKEEER
jgi:hypothetical protein